MKKIFSLSILFASILFMSMSCDPEPIEPEYPIEISTAADLDGMWEFVSVTYNGTYTTCEQIAADAMAAGKSIAMSFTFTASTGNITITDECYGPVVTDYVYNLVGSVTIEVRPDAGSGPSIYSINSYDNTTGRMVLDCPVAGASNRCQVLLQKI